MPYTVNPEHAQSAAGRLISSNAKAVVKYFSKPITVLFGDTIGSILYRGLHIHFKRKNATRSATVVKAMLYGSIEEAMIAKLKLKAQKFSQR